MVFRERLHYRPIKNGQGLNLREYPCLRKLYYHSTRTKGIGARGKNPQDLETYR